MKNQALNYNMNIEYMKYPWLYKKNYYFENNWISTKDQNYPYKLLKNELLIGIKSFCYDINQFTGKKFCNYLKSYLKNIDIKFYNENIISCFFLNSLIQINEKNKFYEKNIEGHLPKIQIISVDHKFNELIGKTKCHFRCVI